MSPARKRAAVEHLQEKFDASERRACEVVDQPRSTQRYTGHPQDDERKLVARMLELVRERPRFGYRRIAALLRGEGWAVNVKRVYRLWRQEGLKVPSKTRKRRGWGTSANACHVRRAEHKDHVWTWDFVFDRTSSGTTLKWLSIMDEHTRESLALKVARSITSEDVIDTLAELFAMRGVPRCVRSDNGPESSPRRLGIGLRRPASRRCTSSRALLGRTATRRVSTADCGTSSWVCMRSGTCGRPARSRRRGVRITTTAGRTARLVTRPPPGSPPGVPTPFGLRPHSVGTPGRARNHYLLPNP